MKKQITPLFVPPTARPRSAPQQQFFPTLPQHREDADLRLAIARVDHSGRVGDRWLIDALGWKPGASHDVTVTPSGAVVTITATGPYVINARGHVFLPTSVRQGLRVDANQRLLLAADLEASKLTIHAIALVAGLLLDHYKTTGEGQRD